MTGSLFSLADLRDHAEHMKAHHGGVEIVNSDELLAVIDALEVATDLLEQEGYATDPDYRQEWATITGTSVKA